MTTPPKRESGRIILITGIMASGKSTVAQRLAGRLPRSVHLRGDLFRRMIVNGRVEVEPDLAQEAIDQLQLRYRLATTAAGLYCAAGFTVVYQDIIIGPDLATVAAQLDEWPLQIVVLCPSPQAVAAREAARPKTGYGEWSIADLDHQLRATTPRLGLWLDTSAVTVEETVDAILAELGDTQE